MCPFCGLVVLSGANSGVKYEHFLHCLALQGRDIPLPAEPVLVLIVLYRSCIQRSPFSFSPCLFSFHSFSYGILFSFLLRVLPFLLRQPVLVDLSSSQFYFCKLRAKANQTADPPT